MGYLKSGLFSMVVYMILFGIIYAVIRFLFLKKTKVTVNWLKEVIIGFFAVYTIGFMAQAILPSLHVYVNGTTSQLEIAFTSRSSLSKINVIPFRTMIQYIFLENTNVDDWSLVGFQNIISSIGLMIPLGILIPMLHTSLKPLRRTLIFGMGISLFVELMQIVVGRSFDIDDIILNGVGLLIGWFLFSQVILRIRQRNGVIS